METCFGEVLRIQRLLRKPLLLRIIKGMYTLIIRYLEDMLCSLQGTWHSVSLTIIQSTWSPASLMMSLVLAGLRTQKKSFLNTCDLVYRLNNLVAETTIEGKYATFFYGVFSLEQNKLVYTNAGHNPPLIARKNVDVSFLEVKSGCAVGVIDSPDFTTEKLVLQRGDLILFYTDGVTEAFNTNGEEFSENRLKNVLTSLVSLPVEQITSGILENVLLFSGEAPQSDDITVLALRYKL